MGDYNALVEAGFMRQCMINKHFFQRTLFKFLNGYRGMYVHLQTMECKKVHTSKKKVSNSTTISFNSPKSFQNPDMKSFCLSFERFEDIPYQSEDATLQTFQIPLIQYHSSSLLGTQFQRYENFQKDGGDD